MKESTKNLIKIVEAGFVGYMIGFYEIQSTENFKSHKYYRQKV